MGVHGGAQGRLKRRDRRQGEADRSRADDHGRHHHVYPVKATGGQESRYGRGSAFHKYAIQAHAAQPGQDVRRGEPAIGSFHDGALDAVGSGLVIGLHDDAARSVVAQASRATCKAPVGIDDHPRRLKRRARGGLPHRQLRVIGKGCSNADHDGVDQRAQAVQVNDARRTIDVVGMAVDGGDSAIEGLPYLPNDYWGAGAALDQRAIDRPQRVGAAFGRKCTVTERGQDRKPLRRVAVPVHYVVHDAAVALGKRGEGVRVATEKLKIGALHSTLASWFGDPGRLSVQRAISELRAGRPVKLNGDGASLMVAAADMLGGARIAQWRAATDGRLGLILPAPRLDHLGMGSSGPAHVALDGLAGDVIDTILLAVAPSIPALTHRPADPLEATALDLVKRAYLLPAAIVMPAESGPANAALDVDARAVGRYHDQSARDLSIAARTRVPLLDSEDTEFVVFRGGDGLRDQVAIVIGHPDSRRPTLTRLHSACLTGDLFASLKCDCGDQLRLAVREIAAAGGGALVYLDQEGRGIGLLNKMRAYGLQALGHDTLDADAVLGYGPDERRYAVAGAMLALLGFRRIVLMTNNPGKITAMEEFGVNVVGHRRLIGGVNSHNHNYLSTKARRAGHLLDEVDRHAAGT